MITSEEKSTLIAEKPEVKPTQSPETPSKNIANQPLGGGKSSLFSVKKRLEEEEKEEENEIPIEDNLPANDFSEEVLQREWTKFLQKLSIDNVVIFSAINAFELKKIGDNQIEVSYSSDTAKKEFENIENEFFNAFKAKVNHFRIEVSYKKNEALKREFLTKRKIFENLAEINPLLKDLETLMKFDFN